MLSVADLGDQIHIVGAVFFVEGLEDGAELFLGVVGELDLPASGGQDFLTGFFLLELPKLALVEGGFPGALGNDLPVLLRQAVPDSAAGQLDLRHPAVLVGGEVAGHLPMVTGLVGGTLQEQPQLAQQQEPPLQQQE